MHPVQQALARRGHTISQIWVAQERAHRKLVEMATRCGVAVRRCPAEEITRLCGSGSHQGVAAEAPGPFPYVDLDRLIDEGAARPAALLLVDGVTDPQNLGAMMRSVCVLGGTGVVLTTHRCASVTPTVVRVAAGAAEHLPCAQVTNLARAIERLQARGVWVGAAAEKQGQSLPSLDLKQPVALVVGSEDRGVRPSILKAADFAVSIPTGQAMSTLNAAAAATVLFYELCRQRAR